MEKTSQQYDIEELVNLLITLMEEVVIKDEKISNIRGEDIKYYYLKVKHKHVFPSETPEHKVCNLTFDGLCGLINLLQYNDIITFTQREELSKLIHDNAPEEEPLYSPWYFIRVSEKNFKESQQSRIKFLKKLLTKIEHPTI